MSAADISTTSTLRGQSSAHASKLFSVPRLWLPVVLVAVGLWWRTSYRRMEASIAAQVVNFFGVDTVRTTGTPKILVLPKTGTPFYALVSFGCSSLSVLLTFAALGLIVVRAPLPRRVMAAAIAAGILFVVNVARVAGVAAVGSRYGITTMARVHDWFGTAVTLLGSVFAAGALYLSAALPNRRVRRSGKRNFDKLNSVDDSSDSSDWSASPASEVNHA
jgi:exosortase/archaeosortase family protein